VGADHLKYSIFVYISQITGEIGYKVWLFSAALELTDRVTHMVLLNKELIENQVLRHYSIMYKVSLDDLKSGICHFIWKLSLCYKRSIRHGHLFWHLHQFKVQDKKKIFYVLHIFLHIQLIAISIQII